MLSAQIRTVSRLWTYQTLSQCSIR